MPGTPDLPFGRHGFALISGSPGSRPASGGAIVAMRHVLLAFALACSLAPPASAADAACGPPPSSPERPDGSAGADARRATATDPCAVADTHLARDEARILAETQPGPIAARVPWDRKTKPRFLDLIRRRFELQPSELAVLGRIGFAVPARLEMPSYAHAYHEVFQSQLPVYVTADSIFHAVFASHDAVVERLERMRLAPLLAGALQDMHCGLPAAAAAAAYPPEIARDLDLYLLVGRRLIGDPEVRVPSAFGDGAVEREADALVAKLVDASELEAVTLFGRPRLVDFTQYGPRGHYADDETLQRYFRAAIWASRLEFNLVSRSSRSSSPDPAPDPSETPREALDALALADLAARSGAAAAIADLDAAWAGLAGRREDVSVAELAAMRAEIGPLAGPDAFPRLKAAIGERFRRTVRLHPMPEGSRELPAIATLIGPRIVADAGALTPLVAGAVPGRERLGIADVAYTLGLDRAKTYLSGDLAAFPTLAGQLDTARRQIADTKPAEDLYGAWLGAVRALARRPEGAVPSFMGSEPALDLRLNGIAAAYGQLKHSYVLVAGQPYSEFGCEIPDGYVEPVPAAYDGLIDYALRGERLATRLDPEDAGGVRAHFARVAQVLRVLRAIVEDELAGRALTPAQRRWLGMVAEMGQDRSQPLTGFPPMYTGWYFDLFLAREADGMRGADYIADYFTSAKGIAYVGATAPRMAVFVVDTGGAPRAFVGPVARAYETFGPLGRRYTDETAKTLAARDEPWAAAYTIPAAPGPSSLQLRYDTESREVVFASDRALGTATVKALDHHRVPFEVWQVRLRQGETRLRFGTEAIGGLYLEIGGFRDFALADAYGSITARWGTPPPDQ